MAAAHSFSRGWRRTHSHIQSTSWWWNSDLSLSLSPDLAAVNKDWRRKQFPNSRVTLANFMQKRWPGTEEAGEMVIIHVASVFVGADLARKAELYFFLLYGRQSP